MLKTVAQRVKEVRRVFRYNEQADLAAVLKVKQASVSNWENGKTIGNKNLDKFEEKLKVRKEWLLFGTGNMLMAGAIVSEPSVGYSGDAWSENAICERFGKVMNDYKLRFGMKQKQVCDEWSLNETHVSGVINGQKPITTTIIQAALRYGNVNVNYIMGGVGGFYNSIEMSENHQIKQLLEMMREQGKKIEELQMSGIKKRA